MSESTPVTNGWVSYRPLLEKAIRVTAPGPVLEMGCGDGSTPWLHDLVNGSRYILSLDNDDSWMRKHLSLSCDWHCMMLIDNWDVDYVVNPRGGRWAAALVDHAPGERRIVDIRRLANICDVVVIHDTEPGQARHGYGYDAIWDLFKFVKHDDRLNTWASACSNVVDVTKWEL